MWFYITLFVFLTGYNIMKDRSSNSPKTVSRASVALAKQGIGKRRMSRKFAVIEKPDIELSEEGKKILDLIENTKTNIFLTGKAGTGKSTLLKYFRATTKKKIVMLAPTGVAAVNVQGQTVHSFFKFGPQITPDRVPKKQGDEAKIYKEVELIIIDEISMVRADLFDCVDKFMRLNGPTPGKPFGGVQVLVVGDLYQLPPIVPREEEQIFKRLYPSPFFFDSKGYDKAGFIKIELTHVYRQADEDFINTLDAFRISDFTDDHLNTINARVVPGYEKPEDEFVISLVTTNAMADTINTSELAKLNSKSRTYTGNIIGDFREKDLPTAMKLVMKEGAQVMLLNNHPQGKWINGDIGKVIKLNENSVRVLFDDGTFDDVGVHKWDAIQFVYEEETKRIQSEIVGTYNQIPLKLAWAVTIHKGQGKTFDKVHIDFGNGTFAPGQAYVALSRCRTLEGMVLASRVESHHIFAHDRVKEFMSR